MTGAIVKSKLLQMADDVAALCPPDRAQADEESVKRFDAAANHFFATLCDLPASDPTLTQQQVKDTFGYYPDYVTKLEEPGFFDNLTPEAQAIIAARYLVAVRKCHVNVAQIPEWIRFAVRYQSLILSA